MLIPISNNNKIAVIVLYVFKNPMCSSCTPNDPIKLIIVIIPPKHMNNKDRVKLVVELI